MNKVQMKHGIQIKGKDSKQTCERYELSAEMKGHPLDHEEPLELDRV